MKTSTKIPPKKYPFAFFRNFWMVLIVLIGINMPVFGQNSTNDVGQEVPDAIHRAEKVWGLMNLFSLVDEVTLSPQINKADRSLFEYYLRQKVDKDMSRFFFIVPLDSINETNWQTIRDEKKQEYLASYADFLTQKTDLALRRAASDNQVLVKNGPCTNIGFDNGTTSGWQASTSTYCTGRVNPTAICAQTNGFTAGEQTITNATMTDPFIPGLSTVAPGGGPNSIRLGDFLNGGHISSITQTFLVTPTNNVFTYQYAVVLEDPGNSHTNPERPYFKVRMYDASGNEISCATYTAFCKPPIQNFTEAIVNNPFQVQDPRRSRGLLDLYYRGWTTVSIPLQNYVGQNVRVVVTAADCALGGHRGYAYFDAKCSSMKPLTPPQVCGNKPGPIKAMDGFAQYAWTGPGIVGATNQQQVMVNKAGQYIVKMIPFTDNIPCPAYDTVMVTEHCAPSPIQDTLCESQKGTLKATGIDLSSYNTPITAYQTGAEVVAWHSGLPASNANILNNTSNLTVSNGQKFYAVIDYPSIGKGSDTAELDFTVLPTPKLTFPAISPTCIGAAAFHISGATPSGGVFFGPHVTASGVFTPAIADTFTLIYHYTSPQGCKDSITQIAVVEAKPLADAGTGSALCQVGNPVLKLKGAVQNAGGGVWSGGNGTFSPGNTFLQAAYTPSASEKNSGSVTLKLTTTGMHVCPPASSTVTYTFAEAPTVNAGPNQDICETQTTVSLAGTYSNGKGVSWSGGSGTFSSANAGASTYTPSASDIQSDSVILYLNVQANAPCKNVKDSTVVSFAPQATVNAGTGTTRCETSPDITLSGTSKKANGVTWSGGTGTFSPDNKTLTAEYTPSASEIASGTVTLTLHSTGSVKCPEVHDQVTYTILKAPIVNAGPDQDSCETASQFPLSGSFKNGTKFQWVGGAGSFSPNDQTLKAVYSPSSAEKKTGSVRLVLKVNGQSPCLVVSDTVTLKFQPLPRVDAGAPQSLCENNAETSLSGSVINATGGRWTGGAGSFSPSASMLSVQYDPSPSELANGFVMLTLTSTGNGLCGAVTDSVKIAYMSPPTLDVKDQTVCKGVEVTFNGVPVNAGTITSTLNYTWYLNNKRVGSSAQLTTKEAGAYRLMVSAGQCTVSDTAILVLWPLPPVDLPQSVKICEDNESSITLDGGEGTRFFWLPVKDSSKLLQVNKPGTYYLTKWNQYGCESQGQVLVREVCPPSLYLSNAFSPNSDLTNDLYKVYPKHVGKFEMLIFNRWGEIIFESQDPHYFWDGNYRGKQMPIGVYPWIITYEGDSEEYRGPYKMEGSVTVVR